MLSIIKQIFEHLKNLIQNIKMLNFFGYFMYFLKFYSPYLDENVYPHFEATRYLSITLFCDLVNEFIFATPTDFNCFQSPLIRIFFYL